MDTRDPIGQDAFYDTVPAALEALQQELKVAGAPLDIDIIGIGHAHLDVAWLWQLSHTRGKCGRTFSNVLRLMEQYPDFHFSQSQPQLYKFTEETYPDIFEAIKTRVKEGRWELIGGTWVEPDCNATGAESLARQFLIGRSYFRKRFGNIDTPVLWLPDTFGYSWALPQLIKQAGMKYFITHKMSWNQYNQIDMRNDSPVATQTVAGGTLIYLTDMAPYSMVALRLAQSDSIPSLLAITETDHTVTIENNLIAVTIERSQGHIASLYDKAVGREILAEGAVGNQLLAMEDRPLAWEAWDVDIFYEDRVEKIEEVLEMRVIETGPIRAGLYIQWQYRSSTITQKIYLYHHSKRLDFDTHIDWHEQHTLLKVAFPVNILSPFATYDIQWGNVKRSTHRNTSWDWGRFETAAQKWADLSEGNYGVALLNDSKYGYDILNNVIRLTLLRSATKPDPKADQGEHLTTYSLLPHRGDWRSGVPENAYDLNDPVIYRTVSGTHGSLATHQFVSVDQPYVVIETVKQAEDGNGVVVRLYESERNRGLVTLQTGFIIKEAYCCNLLEENEAQLEVKNNQIKLPIHPYQIATIRLIPSQSDLN